MVGQKSILIIYTGGTIGMVKDPATGSLTPYNFDEITSRIPELKMFGYDIQSVQFHPPMDSSDISPQVWIRIAETIEEYYGRVHGFVILHGTDTMAYSASALSFMLENLSKPVIFTGAQLPIGTLRTDGRDNLITSIEIAATYENGRAVVPEVCVYFENRLYRGNRTTKVNAEYFNAFQSANYPALVKAGVRLEISRDLVHYPDFDLPLIVHKKFNNHIAILKLFPGINREYMDAILGIEGLRAVILESYGAGNAPTEEWFIKRIRKAVEKGIIILDVTQCSRGSVELGLYETSRHLLNAGVISGYDITTEAATTKLMILLGSDYSDEKIKMLLNKSLKGEISLP
ncbi:MAG: asparaginase [Bacteroidota bacterium]